MSLPPVKWFLVSLFLIISSRLRLATTQSVTLSILTILYVLCRGFVGCWALDCLVLIGDFVVESTLNVLPGLSLFSLVFICIFAVWLMGSCDFCFSCSGLIGDKCLSLSLMFFDGWIGDLCNGCFDGDFYTFRSSSCWSDIFYVCFCLDSNIGSLPFCKFLLSWCLVKFSRV